MVADTCYAQNAFTRKRCVCCIAATSLSNADECGSALLLGCDQESRTERLNSRRFFSRARSHRQPAAGNRERKSLRKRLYYFSFHDAPRYACLRAEREKRRAGYNGGRERWESGVWETFVCYAYICTLGFARAARISADSLMIILLKRSHANRDDCRLVGWYVQPSIPASQHRYAASHAECYITNKKLRVLLYLAQGNRALLVSESRSIEQRPSRHIVTFFEISRFHTAFILRGL